MRATHRTSSKADFDNHSSHSQQGSLHSISDLQQQDSLQQQESSPVVDEESGLGGGLQLVTIDLGGHQDGYSTPTKGGIGGTYAKLGTGESGSSGGAPGTGTAD